LGGHSFQTFAGQRSRSIRLWPVYTTRMCRDWCKNWPAAHCQARGQRWPRSAAPRGLASLGKYEHRIDTAQLAKKRIGSGRFGAIRSTARAPGRQGSGKVQRPCPEGSSPSVSPHRADCQPCTKLKNAAVHAKFGATPQRWQSPTFRRYRGAAPWPFDHGLDSRCPAPRGVATYGGEKGEREVRSAKQRQIRADGALHIRSIRGAAARLGRSAGRCRGGGRGRHHPNNEKFEQNQLTVCRAALALKRASGRPVSSGCDLCENLVRHGRRSQSAGWFPAARPALA